MKKLLWSTVIATALFCNSVTAEPAAKSYQVTGPIVELTDTKIVVQKGDEKWEINRTPETKVDGVLKVGAKVTIHYTMTAKTVDLKPK
jgi:hypothetical protein